MNNKITIGTTSKEALIKKLKAKDFTISTYALQLLDKTTISEEQQDVTLTTITLSEWFTEYPTTMQIKERMKKEGLSFCEPEEALYFATTHKVEKGEWLTFFHEPITDSDGGPGVFRVERDVDGRRWLYADWVAPDGRWDLAYRLVFRLRKSSASWTA